MRGLSRWSPTSRTSRPTWPGVAVGLGAKRGDIFPLGQQWCLQGIYSWVGEAPRSARFLHERCIRPRPHARDHFVPDARHPAFIDLARLWAPRRPSQTPASLSARTRGSAELERDRGRRLGCPRQAMNRPRPDCGGHGRRRPLASQADQTECRRRFSVTRPIRVGSPVFNDGYLASCSGRRLDIG